LTKDKDFTAEDAEIAEIDNQKKKSAIHGQQKNTKDNYLLL